MKKLLLFPVLVFFAACSTDENDMGLTQENNFTNSAQYKGGPTPSCLTSLDAFVTIDVSQGLNNPKVIFTGTMGGASGNMYYKAKVEVQSLADCEDMNSGTGSVTTLSLIGTIPNPTVNSPVITVDPDLLPATPCYRWRMVIDGSGSIIKPKDVCTTASQWYDAPLF